VAVEPQLQEMPAMFERTYAGLDVHARSVVGAAIDGVSGEIRSLRLAPETDAVLAWVASLPAPVTVAYEAGPTGFGLARALSAAGARYVVVAPSKVERPPGDRVKTDRSDAERLARLLRIGELPAVRVPTEAEEAARDLRAREDVGGDLMRARHRLSKLLRYGLVWQGTAWTQEHEGWLRSLSFDRLGVQLAFEEAFDTVLSTHARRGRLDGAIEQMAAASPFAPVVGRLGRLRGISTPTASAWPSRSPTGTGSPAPPSLNQRWKRFDVRDKRPTIAAVAVPRTGRMVLEPRGDGRAVLTPAGQKQPVGGRGCASLPPSGMRPSFLTSAWTSSPGRLRS
jgi:hypothetical protein